MRSPRYKLSWILEEMGTCEEAMDWLKEQRHETFASAWAACMHGEWMVWLAEAVDVPLPTVFNAITHNYPLHLIVDRGLRLALRNSIEAQRTRTHFKDLPEEVDIHLKEVDRQVGITLQNQIPTDSISREVCRWLADVHHGPYASKQYLTTLVFSLVRLEAYLHLEVASRAGYCFYTDALRRRADIIRTFLPATLMETFILVWASRDNDLSRYEVLQQDQ